MNGIEAAKQIREPFPTVRVICFSGHASASKLLAQARGQGHDFEFLAKPVKPDALIDTILMKTV
jgi:DNA-binding NtrC family response regulator